MKTTCLIVALFAAFGAAQAAVTAHPIEKVIGMLQDLEGKAVAEGKEEALSYEKYEYYVKNSVKELDAAIAKEKSDIEELTDLISSKEKAEEVLTEQIADLKQELQDLDAEMKKAKDNRDDGEDIYDDKTSALKLTIKGCQDCLVLLSDAKDATDTGLLQKKVSALVPLVSAKASDKELSLLQKVVDRPDQLAKGDRTKHEKGYAFKSGSVVELLKGLEAKFQDELTEVEKAETNAVNAFELANAARQDNIDAATESKEAKEKELSQVQSDLAEAKGNKKDTEEDLAADSKTLDDTEKAAAVKADEWATRSKTRANEIEAIKVAIGILAKVSGVRTEAPGNPVPPASPIADFLQLSAEPSDPKMKAVELIRRTAKVAHSKALEQLASTIAAHLSGPFDQVNNNIEKMIFRLMDEQKKEDEHKHWCDQELEKSNTSLVDKEDKYEELKEKIENGVAKSAELLIAIKDAQEMVADIIKHMEESTEIRKVGKEENRLAIKDSEAAQDAVSNAIAVLEAHYKDSGAIDKESWEFVQVKKGAAPVTLGDKPSTWDSSYSEVADPKAQPGGIVTVLETINEGFAEMEAKTRAQEQTDQDFYDEEMKNLDIEKARRSKEAEMKEQEMKRTDTKVESMKKAQKGVGKEIEAVEQYLKDLEPACVDGDSSYEDRKAARDKEIEALKEAKGILLNAFGKTAGTQGFLQKHA